MWTEQIIGPFRKGKEYYIDTGLNFPFLDERSSNYGLKYVRIGIQAPQSPYVTETRKIVYYNTLEDQGQKPPLFPEEDGHPRLPESLKKEIQLEGNKTKVFTEWVKAYNYIDGVKLSDQASNIEKNMHSFRIGISATSGTGTGNLIWYTFAINAGEVLEFADLSYPQYFKVQPLQDEDAYTIIEIQYLDDPTD